MLYFFDKHAHGWLECLLAEVCLASLLSDTGSGTGGFANAMYDMFFVNVSNWSMALKTLSTWSHDTSKISYQRDSYNTSPVTIFCVVTFCNFNPQSCVARKMAETVITEGHTEQQRVVLWLCEGTNIHYLEHLVGVTYHLSIPTLSEIHVRENLEACPPAKNGCIVKYNDVDGSTQLIWGTPFHVKYVSRLGEC